MPHHQAIVQRLQQIRSFLVLWTCSLQEGLQGSADRVSSVRYLPGALPRQGPYRPEPRGREALKLEKKPYREEKEERAKKRGRGRVDQRHP